MAVGIVATTSVAIAYTCTCRICICRICGSCLLSNDCNPYLATQLPPPSPAGPKGLLVKEGQQRLQVGSSRAYSTQTHTHRVHMHVVGGRQVGRQAGRQDTYQHSLFGSLAITVDKLGVCGQCMLWVTFHKRSNQSAVPLAVSPREPHPHNPRGKVLVVRAATPHSCLTLMKAHLMMLRG
jgi:hypothetical protein